ncbi:hypothetical protein Pcinc_036676 [Petrolisthes cinctipes]|uniref:ISXO2-like transposase domain-containing protein n=1 Tax=Petrolisthes cinctipes TaxID=88211 RepID=A0AAE1ENF7_PETCI|nr:hypothetical protein Pcinc_036676 [Petrolisthes cinctipes]
MGSIVDGQWVFGGICRKTRSSFMIPVTTRDKDTLLNIIKERIKPGTTIISDCWQAYQCLEDEGYTQLTADHSIKFIDPSSLTSTNNVEKIMRDVKKKDPLFGRRKKNFVGYLARFMFFMEHEEDKRFHHFLQEVATLYNPLQPPQP